MKNKIYVFIVILSGVFWGSSCLFVDYLKTHTPATSVQITAIRIVFAAIVLNLWLIIKGKGFSLYKISGRSWLLCVVSGIGSVLAMGMFYYSCMVETSAAVAVILLYTAPLFVMIMSLFFFKEKMNAQKIIAFIIAIVGCALVSGIASGSKISALGIFLGLMSGFTYSLYGIFTSLFMKENKDTLTFTALSFLFAALGALVISKPWEIVKFTLEVENLPLTLIMYLLLAVCTAVIPFFLYSKGIEGIKPDIASILAFSEPLMACVFGTAVLGQKMDVFGVIGIVCVCAAIVVLNVNFKKKVQ
ncbi:MAG: EamA family transporter [Clostridia bacterium]|nr:EamA family transporter [Clostridia bacterium]